DAGAPGWATAQPASSNALSTSRLTTSVSFFICFILLGMVQKTSLDGSGNISGNSTGTVTGSMRPFSPNVNRFVAVRLRNSAVHQSRGWRRPLLRDDDRSRHYRGVA